MTGTLGQHSVISRFSPSWVAVMETGTLESRKSSGPSHRAGGCSGECHPSDTDPARVCAHYSQSWGATGEQHDRDVLPNLHLGLVRNRLGNPSGVNHSNWGSSAKKGAISDLSSRLYAPKINKNSTDVDYFTFSTHLLSDLPGRTMRNLPWRGGSVEMWTIGYFTQLILSSS